jgi:energy-coupling factor transporter ATP-binding protein EcfA2
LRESRRCFDSDDATAEPDRCPIVGESGSGKTTIVSYFSGLYACVDHKWGVEVPVLVAKVPARPTVKSLAETTPWTKILPRKRASCVAVLVRLFMWEPFGGLLALDEFQHFVDVRQANILRGQPATTMSGSLATYIVGDDRIPF